MEIRTAVPEDAEGIARVFLDSADHHARLDPERYFTPEYDVVVERYRHGLQHPQRPAEEIITLVAEIETQIAGFVDARLERPFDAMHRQTVYCYIAEVAVSAKHRSGGVGERLVRAAEEWGRRLGAEFASLEYNSANTRAGIFYRERLGYKIASITAIKRL
jgi:ribosomal protein S18 acetylase RimI-like enzyme